MNLKLSETIKHLRRSKNLTHDDVATTLGVSYQAVSRWENGLAYPDIEQLPNLAVLFGVTMDELFGMDELSESQTEERYDRELGNDIDANIELTKKYIDLCPKSNYFKYMLMFFYRDKGLEYAKAKLATMRKMCHTIIDTSDELEWYRIPAIKLMIDVEDDENVDEWLVQLDNRSWSTSREALIERYFYRGEVDSYNYAIQQDIMNNLKKIFDNDFCKRDKKTYKNAASRASGQHAILSIIDALRDTSTDVDAWLKVRAFAYLRLAAGEFGTGNKDAGYAALERSVELYELYASLDAEAELRYNSPPLDELYEKAGEDREIEIKCAYRSVNEPSGWEWFNSVRNDDRYKSLAERLKTLTTDN